MSTYSATVKFPLAEVRLPIFLEGSQANLLMSVRPTGISDFLVTFVGTFKNLEAHLKAIAETEKQQEKYLAAIHCLDE